MELVNAYTTATDLPPLSPQETSLDDLPFTDEEFTEADVLPFLLQAQDIIAKLESRVVELETDLSSIHRKYEHDRHDWLVGLSQKDQFIHHLSSKLQKLEFNGKQVIVLLNDCMNTDDKVDLTSTLSLCLSYLRNTNNTNNNNSSNNNNNNNHVKRISIDDELEEGELERRQAATNQWKQQQPTRSLSSTTWQPVNLMDGLDSSSHGNSLDDSDSSRVETDSSITNNTMHASHDHCANCKQLLTQLDQQIEQKAYLKRDLGALASALAEEEQVRESVEQSRLDLIEDIQDITSSLFDTLNQVLMDDVTDREGLLRLNRDLDGALINVLQSWDIRDQRLKQIKDLLVDLDASAHQSTTIDRSLSLGHDESSTIPSLYQSQHSRTMSSTLSTLDESLFIGTSYDKSTVRLDGVNFREFQDHLKALKSNKNKNSKVILPSTTFMKRVLAEDVEPCLFQNNGNSWWKSPWFKRKLLDAIANNKCEIQHAVRPLLQGTGITTTTTTTTTLSSSSISSSSTTSPSIASSDIPMPPKTKCTCCGLLRVCEFKMRLHHPSTTNLATKQQQQQQPWLPIDRFCRDRLVAVCDFYGFVSHLPQAVTQNTPVLVMFKQSLVFRRKMAMAKVGSIGLFTSGDLYGMEVTSPGLRTVRRRASGSVKRQSRSSKRESIVLDHSGNASDTGSVVSLSDIQGLDGTSQIVIVH
ncbi:uncharacterized protein BX664DRAFT_272656 [Halteromyces radiatus]|uniref:uncharacterized protein n=1 Tax=Halteromyces radiatus TaxID=101107 RepID=UPI00222097A7|nr:uncharacterized protein BX664DRAFT_272656 [Halteromyces radiatus]KAI8099424.1 hypothetical protein BX664DRAFT_272656 [Halteromyces radiatus]